MDGEVPSNQRSTKMRVTDPINEELSHNEDERDYTAIIHEGSEESLSKE
jgi:hypothetical protein